MLKLVLLVLLVTQPFAQLHEASATVQHYDLDGNLITEDAQETLVDDALPMADDDSYESDSMNMDNSEDSALTEAIDAGNDFIFNRAKKAEPIQQVVESEPQAEEVQAVDEAEPAAEENDTAAVVETQPEADIVENAAEEVETAAEDIDTAAVVETEANDEVETAAVAEDGAAEEVETAAEDVETAADIVESDVNDEVETAAEVEDVAAEEVETAAEVEETAAEVEETAAVEETQAVVESVEPVAVKAQTKAQIVQGKCIIIYSQCTFKGEAMEVCESLSQIEQFKHEIKSIYIPEGLGLTVYDGENFEGASHKYTSSQACLKNPISFAQIKNNTKTLTHNHVRKHKK